MGEYELIDHTADVGLLLKARDLDDLFVTAAEAMFNYIVANPDSVRPDLVDSVTLEAPSPGDLLVSWLNELIFLCETRHRLYTRFDVRVLQGGTRLESQIHGEAMNSDRHILDHEVKAVTRHDFDLTHHDDLWTTTLILDI